MEPMEARTDAETKDGVKQPSTSEKEHMPDEAGKSVLPEGLEASARSHEEEDNDDALLAELEEWRQKVQQQRHTVAKSENERTRIREEVARLKQQVDSLTSEREHLLKGGALEDAEEKQKELEAKLLSVREEKADIEASIAQQEQELAAARSAAAAAAESANASAEKLAKEEKRLHLQRQEVEGAEAYALAAEERLQSMVAVEEVQDREREAKQCREALASVDKEARQLRLALADALSSGTDLSTAKRELEVLRDSQEAAAQRAKALEGVNMQLERRIAQVEEEIQRLKKGTVDLRSEGDLMKEVIISQSEQLLRKVEDLTEEEKVADEDRRQLLATAARLAEEVEVAETRIARQSDLEEQSKKLDAAQLTLSAEVERLRRTNDALCQQVLGPDGEGPFAGVLSEGSMLDGEEDLAIRDDIGRLVRGQLLLSTQAGSMQADAAALALRLQQLLAEREEAFWVDASGSQTTSPPWSEQEMAVLAICWPSTMQRHVATERLAQAKGSRKALQQ
eukprot:CAMPEP_0197638870 /NCGR_PEP_ID=MMETSP1338-20131121/13669_1 /TAXON_ID=43686 ORGANISM="Pelagodinium beii, Strain RCC1491" /NCGR_SAMPLE_ID=MMETSP1338 /ASSEMBLY_ACC=CAM_ASM_000754 /LENGTH=510 /DNA_ID=CAMNT_0043211523 /DNA_START=73 /DNA_END=1603 /DNA_ORIENTATION=-